MIEAVPNLSRWVNIRGDSADYWRLWCHHHKQDTAYNMSSSSKKHSKKRDKSHFTEQCYFRKPFQFTGPAVCCTCVPAGVVPPSSAAASSAAPLQTWRSGCLAPQGSRVPQSWCQRTRSCSPLPNPQGPHSSEEGPAPLTVEPHTHTQRERELKNNPMCSCILLLQSSDWFATNRALFFIVS